MIGIIILNYINWDDTEKCLRSIISTTYNIKYHIYLIDNASSNQIPGQIINLLDIENITFIQNKKNVGFSAGNNVGIKRALEDECDDILIVNNDVILLKDSILDMHNYLKQHIQIGIVGPKILNLDGSIEIPSMLIKTGLKEKYLVNTPLRYISNYASKNFYCPKSDFDKTFKVYAVRGCCFMMTRKCATDITPFDENTFLFEEELIIGINMEKKGYITMYYPKSTVIHAHGQSTKIARAFSFICFVQSEIYYCKNYLHVCLIRILPLYVIRTLSYFIRSFKYKDYRKNGLLYIKETFKYLFRK